MTKGILAGLWTLTFLITMMFSVYRIAMIEPMWEMIFVAILVGCAISFLYGYGLMAIHFWGKDDD
jgi:ABC-type uncharacterized transport system permease subunit